MGRRVARGLFLSFGNLTGERIMTPFVLVMTALSLPFAPAPAEEPAALPKGGPPQFVFVSGIDKDKGTLKIQASISVPVTKAITVEKVINGMKVQQVVNVTDYQISVKEESFPLATFRVLDAQGKEIDADVAWKKLAEGKLMLRQSGPEPLDPAYLKLFAKDTLILAPKPPKDMPPK
jgi:hypothetical protein